MGISQLEAEIEDETRLFFESGEAVEIQRGLGIGAHLGLKLTHLHHIKIVVGVDQVENLLFLFGDEDRSLQINPLIQICAGDSEKGQFVGVVINTEAEDGIVEFQKCLLDMIGDLETLKL